MQPRSRAILLFLLMSSAWPRIHVAGHKRALDTDDAVRPSVAQHDTQQPSAAQRSGDSARARRRVDRGAWEVRVMRAFVTALQDPRLEPTSDFFAAGGDSLAAAATAAELDVPPQLLAGFRTARGLAAHLAANAASLQISRSGPQRESPLLHESLEQTDSGSLQHGPLASGSAERAAILRVPVLEAAAPGTRPAVDTGACPTFTTSTDGQTPDPDRPALVLSKGGSCRAAGLVQGADPQQATAELRPSASAPEAVSFSLAWRVPLADCVDAATEIVTQRTLGGGVRRVTGIACYLMSPLGRCDSHLPASTGSAYLWRSWQVLRSRSASSARSADSTLLMRRDDRLVGVRLLAWW